MIDALRLDLRYAVRTLRRTPLFALGVALTIGLGLGVWCSGFTVMNGYLLKPYRRCEPPGWTHLTRCERIKVFADPPHLPHLSGSARTDRWHTDIFGARTDQLTGRVLFKGVADPADGASDRKQHQRCT